MTGAGSATYALSPGFCQRSCLGFQKANLLQLLQHCPRVSLMLADRGALEPSAQSASLCCCVCAAGTDFAEGLHQQVRDAAAFADAAGLSGERGCGKFMS